MVPRTLDEGDVMSARGHAARQPEREVGEQEEQDDQRGIPRPTTRSKSALGAPMSAMTCEKIDAKMMMSITIEVVRIVSWKASFSVRHVSRRARAARSRLTSEPRAAASVGVTMPTYIEPRTTTISSATGA